MSSPRHSHAITTTRRWLAAVLAMVLALAVGVVTTTTARASSHHGADNGCPEPGQFPEGWVNGLTFPQFTDNAPAMWVGGDLDSNNAEFEGLSVIAGDAVFRRSTNVGDVGVGSGIAPGDGEVTLRVGGNLTVEGQVNISHRHRALVGGTFTGDVGQDDKTLVRDGVSDPLGEYVEIAQAVIDLSAALADPGQTGTVYGKTILPDLSNNAHQVHLDGSDAQAADGTTYFVLGNEETAGYMGKEMFFTNIPDNDAPIIINVPGRDVTWAPTFIALDGRRIDSPPFDGNMASRIIWNFYEADTVTITQTSQITGSFLVPNPQSHVVNSQSTNGRMYVNGDLTLNGGGGMEHHNYPWIIPSWPGQCDDKPSTKTIPATVEFTKTLSGEGLETLDPTTPFTFTLTAQPRAGMTAGEETLTLTAGDIIANGGTVTSAFDGWTFEASDEPYVLTLREESGNHPDIAYSPAVYTVTITVTEGADDELTQTTVVTEASGSAAPAAFTNVYTQPDPGAAEVTLPVGKFLSGGPTISDRTFTFTHALADEYGDAITLPSPAESTVTVPAGSTGWTGTATLTGIRITEPGQYDVSITETPGNDMGTTYSTQRITATIDARLDGGAWQTDITYTGGSGVDADTFDNIYTYPEDGSIQLGVTKAYAGPDPEASRTFAFRIECEPDCAGIDMPVDQTVSLDVAAGTTDSAAFDRIGFTAVGDYYFRIQEVPPSEPGGIIYDQRTVTAHVRVTEGDPGLVATLVGYEGGAPDVGASGNGFANTYNLPEPAPLGLSFTKLLTGHNWPDAAEITFDIATTTPDGLHSGQAVTTVTPADLRASNGIVRVDGWEATAPGTYTLTVTERDGKATGVTYDRRTLAFTWEVGLNVLDNTLVVPTHPTVTLTSADGPAAVASFTNHYERPAELAIPFTKIVTGTGAPGDEAFTFILTCTSGACDTVTIPNGTVTITSADAQRPGGVAGAFTDITFAQNGRFGFTITESKGTTEGMRYAGPQSLTVDVDRGTDGYLAATLADSTTPPTFENVFRTPTPSDGRANLAVDKTVVGDGAPGEVYTFTAKRTDGGPADAVTLPVADGKTLPEATVTVDPRTGAGSTTFDEFVFHKAGVYTFLVEEVAGGTPGMDYDKVGFTATFVVDQDDDQLVAAAPTYTGKGEGVHGFTNTYTEPDPKPAVESLRIEKRMVAHDEGMGQATFSFTLSQWEEDEVNVLPAPVTKTLTMDPGGKAVTLEDTVSFDPLPFTEAGEYRFTLVEDPGTMQWMHYDLQTTVTAFVTVYEEDGELKTIVRYSDGRSLRVDSLENGFENHFKKDEVLDEYSVVGTLSVRKQLKADDGMPAAAFQFTLRQVETDTVKAFPTAPRAVVLNMTQAGVGEVAFEQLTFPEAGTYHFEMRETAGAMSGMSYDDAVVTATVVVTDTGTSLVTDISYEGGAKVDLGDESAIHANGFVNTWTAEEAEKDEEAEKEEEKEENGEPTVPETDSSGFPLARTSGGTTGSTTAASGTTTSGTTGYALARTGAQVLGIAAAAGALILGGLGLIRRPRRDGDGS